ncbi:MAG: hypothetical protein A2937_03730 [Candidatus Yonathbacteria bacterium RIFCSPLOWO2_01_FULL_47_33b]|uniref:Peptidase M15A C-terminal domain-containing protein n=1 Tax=Candidatus Yonathbacteria bacterium RIFCSPLOWO2_01_FULL_47_33b TaxID=1802727 RepID=A0A1G2SEJ8_9BACT|nr:MAG: hypothetical protein A2937_03730 [Candidatus Yonathbacteria bacterium RIFCSPLOWO2_01_FULL_47_33b]
MNTSHLFRVAILLLGALLISSPAQAAKKPTDKERKERANAEYIRCMAVVKNDGVSAMLAYVRSSQKGTSLKSNPEKLAQENCVADGIGLMRYQDLGEILADDGDKLVPLRSSLVRIKDDVPQARHVARPWTRDYLIELATYLEQTPGMKKVAHSDAQILVASLVRSRADQDVISRVTKAYYYIKGKLRKLTGGKRSFADCSSKAVCSTHLTGATVDISLLGADRKKRKLLIERLLEDREEGRILAILENAGNHFHVFVIPPQPAGPVQLLVTPTTGPDVHEVPVKTPAS